MMSRSRATGTGSSCSPAIHPRPKISFLQPLDIRLLLDTQTTKKNHYILSEGERSRAGLLPIRPPLIPILGPAGSDLSGVKDIDSTLAQAGALGGQVLVPAHGAEFGSRFAIIQDPTGGIVGLVQFVDNANPADRP